MLERAPADPELELEPLTIARTTPVTPSVDLVGTLPGIVWEADGTDYRMAYVSPRARDILGLDPDEWTRVPDFWEAHVHPDDLAGTTAVVETALDALEAATCEYRFRAGDGSYRHVRDTFQVLERADGHRQLVGFMQDISAEAAAGARHRLLATAVDQASESVVLADQDGITLYVNPAFERVSGYSRDEAVGRRSRLLGSGEQATAEDAARWATLAAGSSWSGDLVNHRADGSPVIEEASITPVVDAGGRTMYYVAVNRDVTEERANQEVAARLAAIVQSAVDACYANAPDGTFLAWNDAAARIYGWSSEEVIGRRIFDLVPAEEHASIEEWLRRAGGGETIGPVDTVHRGRDGRSVILSVIAAPVVDRTGRVTGVATIGRDVSADRRLAAERRDLENELLQAQKLEAIGRLAGGIAHDFNNMLTAISGYASLVAASVEEPQLSDIGQVLHAAERAADLTRRLMAFSRPQLLDPRPVDVDAVLHEAFGMVRRLVPERIDLSLDAEANGSVLADPVEIEQLFLNLVVNAADAIEGTGQIRVRTRRVSRPDDGASTGVRDSLRAVRDSLVLTVSDTGAGMDAATRSRIFEPFFTTKQVGSGTGLGLATVHAIVRRAGGSIDLRSAPGQGTTFVVKMPIVRPAAPPEVTPLLPAPRGREHVLVVDDSEVIGLLAGRMLEQAGYRVSVASSPLEVLARGVDGVDAMVTDVVMPGMSGPELVAALRLEMPVVFMSGYTADHDPAAMRVGPQRTFIGKPFAQDDLLGALRAVLDHAAAARPA